MDGQQAEVPCVNKQCGQTFIAVIPTAEIINSVGLSLIAWSHPDITFCPHCNQGYLLKVTHAAQVEFGWKAIQTRESAILVPPAGLKLPPFPDRRG